MSASRSGSQLLQKCMLRTRMSCADPPVHVMSAGPFSQHEQTDLGGSGVRDETSAQDSTKSRLDGSSLRTAGASSATQIGVNAVRVMFIPKGRSFTAHIEQDIATVPSTARSARSRHLHMSLAVVTCAVTHGVTGQDVCPSSSKQCHLCVVC